MLVYLMGLLYVGAGVSHFLDPEFYHQIVPPMLPAAATLVVISGIAEIALGVAVMIPATRRLAAWGIIALLIAVYPANIHMAVNDVQLVNPPAWMGQPSPLGLWLRLPGQLLLMYWAWRYTR